MLTRLVAIGLVLLLIGPREGGAQPAASGAVQVGDRWSYDIKDTLTGDLRRAVTVVVVEVTNKEITTRESALGRDHPQTTVYDLDWGRIDDGVWQLRPSGIGIKLPLQTSKEWRSDANVVNSKSGVVLRATGTAKVVRQEQVTTSAGTFDSFRIDMTVRMINTRDQTRSETWAFVVWYAPVVNRWVKRTAEFRQEGRLRDSYSEELTKYSRKQ
jgi:hypothetical protein